MAKQVKKKRAAYKAKPSGKTKYARKKTARQAFLARGNTIEQWREGRMKGTILV